ncbi:hypothetical protein DVA67_013705 [Solirubrobacter sp. CPCC 204708]|uniref:Collagen-like protein n=1 Tax=Solirubrobacter deserti TaxID=2282478 RepID=A0ABT4RC19_9ACTN|nr:hypothetical protein [Solirubrobacter deserti]MBE2317032.1 hypothetical protein [Solirubrobacter deserti]MDA0136076.1 hypothetical protein [Solirubrobacter deserti]
MRTSIKVAAATLLLAGAAAGVGQAAISNDGVVTMCVNNVSGAVRAVDPTGVARPCANTETVLPMNQKGPAGPAGPQGPAGPAGVASKPHMISRWVASNLGVGTSFGAISKVELAKGAYHITAKGTAWLPEQPYGRAWAAVSCQLRIRHHDGVWDTLDATTVEVSDEGPEYGTFSMQGLTRVVTADPESIRFECKDDGGPQGQYVLLRNLNLHVMPIGDYTQTQEIF